MRSGGSWTFLKAISAFPFPGFFGRPSRSSVQLSGQLKGVLGRDSLGQYPERLRNRKRTLRSSSCSAGEAEVAPTCHLQSTRCFRCLLKSHLNSLLLQVSGASPSPEGRITPLPGQGSHWSIQHGDRGSPNVCGKSEGSLRSSVEDVLLLHRCHSLCFRNGYENLRKRTSAGLRGPEGKSHWGPLAPLES